MFTVQSVCFGSESDIFFIFLFFLSGNSRDKGEILKFSVKFLFTGKTKFKIAQPRRLVLFDRRGCERLKLKKVPFSNL